MMISAFDLLKAMNEEACYKSTIEEKACKHVYYKKSTKALSLSDVFLDVIVKKVRVVWKENWMNDDAWSNSRRFFIVILLINLIL